MEPITAVVFDMDGTLIDTERVSQTAWRRAAADLGIEMPQWILTAFVGCSLPNARGLILPELGGDEDLVDRLFAHQHELFFQIEDEELEARPGALEAIQALDAAGLTVALATSTAREHALPLMERFGMAPYFASMTFGDEIARAKPEPDIYLEAAHRLDMDPRACAAVEDSVNGVRAAVAAQMHTYMVPEWVEPSSEVTALCAGVLSSLYDLPAAILGEDAAASPATHQHAEPQTRDTQSASVDVHTEPQATGASPASGTSDSLRTKAQTAAHQASTHATSTRPAASRPTASRPTDPFIRAENEDDDGYDPYSDRPPEPEPLFEADPWD